ncbi:MAG: MarR family transcriptional regulator [Oscillospiraceae bacterium]|nr:MarR family transcriptional regulator [Oscillospiraceae bacterium]
MAKTGKKARTSPMSLSNDLAKLFEKETRLEMQRSGIKLSYKQLLHPLCAKDGVNQLDLVNLTGLKAPTVSITLRSMETDGLVTRKNDEKDSRIMRVYITEKGRETDKKIRAVISKTEKLFHSALTPEEKEQLATLLYKIKQGLGNTAVSAEEEPAE